MYKYLLKPILFLLPAETAHHLTVWMLSILVKIPGIGYLMRQTWVVKDMRLHRSRMGLHFENPIGLAAGFDKNGEYIEAMSHLGFGFIEVGTVTPVAQVGNPRPRLFRLPKDKALINRMGFNNKGVDALVKKLQQARRAGLMIGGNIGKNKQTANRDATGDYEYCFKQLYHHVDYFVVNVSSPNTPGLRDLQEKAPLLALLNRLQELNQTMGAPKPILLKIAPDLTSSQIDDVIEVIESSGLEGVIATNTTIEREDLSSGERIEKIGAGGLSGRPLLNRSTEVIRYLRNKLGTQRTIIGVGGIDSPQTARQKLEAGADLIQVYSGLIFEGPFLIKRISKGLLDA